MSDDPVDQFELPTLADEAEGLGYPKDSQEYKDLVGSALLDGVPQEVVDLLNMDKRPNLAVEFKALCGIVGLGVEVPEVAKAMHLTQAHVNETLRAAVLGPELLAGVEAGEIASGVAKRLVRMTEAERAQARAKFAVDHKLTGQDVEGLHHKAKREAVAQLPADLFREDPHLEAAQMARDYVKRFPELDAAELLAAVQAALAERHPLKIPLPMPVPEMALAS